MNEYDPLQELLSKKKLILKREEAKLVYIQVYFYLDTYSHYRIYKHPDPPTQRFSYENNEQEIL